MESLWIIIGIIAILATIAIPIGATILIVKLGSDYLAKKIAKEIALNNQDLAYKIAAEIKTPYYNAAEWYNNSTTHSELK